MLGSYANWPNQLRLKTPNLEEDQEMVKAMEGRADFAGLDGIHFLGQVWYNVIRCCAY